MRNGLKLTFGQINGLAADFYATKNPISDGGDLNGQTRNFQAAFDALDKNSVKMPAEATTILGMLQDEVDEINKAAAAGIDPSTVYAKLTKARHSSTLPWIAQIRSSIICSSRLSIGIILELMRAQHRMPAIFKLWELLPWAIWSAVTQWMRYGWSFTDFSQARSDLLAQFACHYLEDSFSAGHIRTPRRVLHSGNDVTADKCAQVCP